MHKYITLLLLMSLKICGLTKLMKKVISLFKLIKIISNFPYGILHRYILNHT